MKKSLFAPLAALMGANLFFSGNYMVGGIAMASMPLMSLMFIKWFAAAIPMLIIAHYVERPDWRRVLASWKKILLMGALGIAGYGFMFYEALTKTSPMNAGLINAFNPALIALASAVFLNEALTKRKLGGIAIAFCGVVWVLTAGNPIQLLSQTPNVGDLWMLGSIACWAAYTIIARRGGDVPPLSSCALQMIFFTAFMTPYTVIHGLTLPSTSAAAWSMAYIAIFPSALAFALWNYGAKHIDPGIAGQTLNLTVPFIAVMTLLAGGTIGSVEVVGGALVLFGVYLTLLKPKTKTLPTPVTRSA